MASPFSYTGDATNNQVKDAAAGNQSSAPHNNNVNQQIVLDGDTSTSFPGQTPFKSDVAAFKQASKKQPAETLRAGLFYNKTGFGRRLLRPNLITLNLVLAGCLLGFFLWNFITLTIQYVNELNDPPVKATVSIMNTGEPFYPAIVLCNTQPDVPLMLVNSLYQPGLNKPDQACHTVGFENSSTSQCGNPGFPEKNFYYYFSYRFNDVDEEDGATPDGPSASSFVSCVAINATQITGYTLSPRTRKPKVAASLYMFFDLNPMNVTYGGLTPAPFLGLDVYFYSRWTDLPAQFEGQILNSTAGLSAAVNTGIVSAGVYNLYALEFSESVDLEGNSSAPTQYSYSPSALTAKLNPVFLQTVYQSPVKLDDFVLVNFAYSTPRMEKFEFSGTSFSQTFGSVSGWAGSLLGWDCLGLLFLIEKASLLMFGARGVVAWSEVFRKY